MLLSPAFVVALAVLLVNDHYLKAEFHNLATGKLSDVAGLFVFAAFWSALFPRVRRCVTCATVLGFVYWKSPASAPMLEYWNQLELWKAGRVEDPTDLVALAVVPFATRLAAGRSGRPRAPRQRIAAVGVALLSLFAFAATTIAHRTGPPVFLDAHTATYEFDLEAVDLLWRLRVLEHGTADFHPSFSETGTDWPGDTAGVGDSTIVWLPLGDTRTRGKPWLRFSLQVVSLPKGSGIVVHGMEVPGDTTIRTNAELTALLESMVIEPLRADDLRPSWAPPRTPRATDDSVKALPRR